MGYLTEAGPLVWLVLLLGVLALVAAIRYAIGQQRQQVSLALGGAVAAMVVAVLNMLAGFQKAIAPIGQLAAEKRWIYLIGLSESLNGVVVALAVALLVSLLLTVGSYRRGGLGAAH